MNIPDKYVIKYMHNYLSTHAVMKDMRDVYTMMLLAKKTGKGLDNALDKMHRIYNKVKILDCNLQLQRQEYLAKGE